MVANRGDERSTNNNNVQQFEALFNFATIGIVVTNSEGRIINFNKYAEVQFGYTSDEIIGELVEKLLPAHTHSRHENHRDKYFHHPEPRIMGHGRDLYAQKKDGSTFPVEVSLSHYTLNDQTFVIAFVIDITVRKTYEELAKEQTRELERITSEIKMMNAELEQKVEDRTKMLREALTELEHSKEELNIALENEKELNELKSGFVTVASHEFRTPLSTILSSAYLLDKYNDINPNPKVAKHLDRIKNAVSGMKNILEDFLSVGKLEEGLVQTKMETIEPALLNNIVSGILHELDVLLKAGQKIDYRNEVNENVMVDKNLLKNILLNLVSNAIKFSEVDNNITVSLSINNDDLVVQVSDSGIGISAEDQQHLFERFFRAKNASNIQGTGLGLHIVRRYLDLMNGRISLSSELNKGTTITTYIPQKPIYEEDFNH